MKYHSATSASVVFTRLQRVAGSLAHQVYGDLHEHHLTSSQYAVLEILSDQGALCQRDIADKICKSGGNITLVIDNLEKRGLVVRRRLEEDRRYFEIELTRRGVQRMTTLQPAYTARIEAAMRILLPEELAQFNHLLGRLGFVSDTANDPNPGDDYTITPKRVYDE